MRRFLAVRAFLAVAGVAADHLAHVVVTHVIIVGDAYAASVVGRSRGALHRRQGAGLAAGDELVQRQLLLRQLLLGRRLLPRGRRRQL
jgi:hypothetical protein